MDTNSATASSDSFYDGKYYDHLGHEGKAAKSGEARGLPSGMGEGEEKEMATTIPSPYEASHHGIGKVLEVKGQDKE